MILNIRTLDDLEWASDYCHDALFETDKAVYDKTSKMFLLPLVREMWEKAEIAKRKWIFQWWKIPKTQSILLFHNVIDISIKFNQPDDILTGIDYDDENKAILIKGMKGSTFRLDVDVISGKLEDKGDIYHDGGRILTINKK